MEHKRVSTSEKTKPTMSCTVEPGRMSTQKPTRNSCGAQAGGQSDVDDSAVLVVVAIERVVHPQEASAVVKLLAVEGLKCARGDQREGEEQQIQQIWQRPNKPSLETGGLALGEDLSGHTASQNK
eukprot:scaffold38580_cov75-Phaeocystis_antarctica.AAC.1